MQRNDNLISKLRDYIEEFEKVMGGLNPAALGVKAPTLKDFQDKILRPSILQGIKQGKFDNAIFDKDVFLMQSEEVQDAIIDRIKVLYEISK